MNRSVPNGALALITFASPGRSFFLGLGEPRFARPVLMSPEGLEAIAHTEPGHRLLLWQYAKASDRFRANATVHAFDPLDEFSVWRHYGFSYYMSDEGRPTSVLIPPGAAIDMRIEARDALDNHGVPAAELGHTVEVSSGPTSRAYPSTCCAREPLPTSP